MTRVMPFLITMIIKAVTQDVMDHLTTDEANEFHKKTEETQKTQFWELVNNGASVYLNYALETAVAAIAGSL